MSEGDWEPGRGVESGNRVEHRMTAGEGASMAVDWVAVALSADVPAGTAHPVLYNGMELVVWRSTGGSVRVWADRCPHRGMRLSFGFVRGETLACLYHGWRFGTDGGCRKIPAHPDLEPPATITTDRRTAVEASGLVWLAPGAEPPASPPPDLPADAVPLRSLAVSASVDEVDGRLSAVGAVPLDPGIFRLDTPLGSPGPWLILALQPTAPGSSTLHLLAGTADPARLDALALFAESLRRRLEAAPAAA